MQCSLEIYVHFYLQDFNDRPVSYQVGNPTIDRNNAEAIISKDDKDINGKIEHFQKFLKGASLLNDSKNNKSITRQGVKKPSGKELRTETSHFKLPTTDAASLEKSKIKELTTEKPQIEVPKTVSNIIEERNKTYGMNLSGDKGFVWNVSRVLLILLL